MIKMAKHIRFYSLPGSIVLFFSKLNDVTNSFDKSFES